jgi:hypothetical protein
MKALAPMLVLLAAAFGWAQNANPGEAKPGDVQPPTVVPNRERKHDSGPLAWVGSDINPKTVFWIQGRFVAVDGANHEGDAEVATILCSPLEYECLVIDSTSPLVRAEQVWIDEFKPISWDSGGIMATSRSLDGCTDETLKIHFSPPSVLIINSPVLPMSGNCKKVNGSWDTLVGKKRSAITGQMEQSTLVPTRGLVPFQDVDSEPMKSPAPAHPKNP